MFCNECIIGVDEVVLYLTDVYVVTEELLGKFTFAAPSYSVLESAGIIEIDVLFHRRPPP